MISRQQSLFQNPDLSPIVAPSTCQQMNENPYQSPDVPNDLSEEKVLVPSLTATWDVSLLSSIVTSAVFSLLSFPAGLLCYLFFQVVVKGYLGEQFWTNAFETGQRFAPFGFAMGLCVGWFTPWIMSLTVRVTRRHARRLRMQGTSTR